MSTALVLDHISSEIHDRIFATLSGLNLTQEDIVIQSPQSAQTDKIGIYIYHINRNPHFINDPLERVSAGRYRQQILVVDAGLVVYSTFSDSRRELNYMENIADSFFHSPTLTQTDGPFENIVKIIPKTMGLDELNKFWAMFPGKSQTMAHFYQLAPIFVFPQQDLVVDSPEVRPVAGKAGKPNIILTTQILSE